MAFPQFLIYLGLVMVGGPLFTRACVWMYWAGYGDAPRNVVEPVRVLSNGESRPYERPKYGDGNLVATSLPFDPTLLSNCAYSVHDVQVLRKK